MTNQLTFKNVASRCWGEISDWFNSTRYFNEDSFISRLRFFQIRAFSFLFIVTFFNFIFNLGFNYIITSVACTGLIVVRYLIDHKRVKEAYALMLFCINFTLILLTYFEGLRSGVFLFFFPSILSFSFLTDLTNKKNVLLTYVVGAGSFITSVIIAPDTILDGGNISEIVSGNFFMNIIISFSLIVWMSFNLANENYRKQSVLSSKEVFLDTIFNSSLHTEIVVDMESGLISSFNQQARTIFTENGGEDLYNKSASELFLECRQWGNEKFARELYNPFSNWSGELTCVRMDGNVFPASVSVVTFKYQEKYYKKITIVDITEKNQILSELQAAKKKAEEFAMTKSQFLSNMSHELRTPLNGIIGSTNLLLQDTFLPEQKDQLSILKYSSEHMLSLINDILDLSKLEADRIQLERTEVDISELIHKISSPFVPQFERKGLGFEIAVDSNLKTSVLADPTRLNQVLTNLLSNALKFTSNGCVRLEVKGNSIRSDFNSIEFSVTDTGIGINEDKLDQVFEQFTQADLKTTRKYGGTGLGLSISQKLVRLMGGELKVNSKINKGSRFYFEVCLPVHYSHKKIHIASVSKVNNDKQLNGMKVLIAEDNPINMKIASRFLDKWGVNYEMAKNGLEAVSLFEHNQFDLVLMDLEMPEMDGYGALNAIRGINSKIPAIAFTAAVFDNMKESLINKGFNDYIQKPFRPQDLQAKLVAISSGLVKSA